MNPYQNLNDTELVNSLKEGDAACLEAIYRKYVGDLFRYLRKNIYNKEDCEEIIQEIFESLWTRRESLEIKSSLQAYLIGMVRHKIIRYFRKSALKKKYTDHFLLFEAVYEQVDDREIDHEAIQSTLEKLVSELPDRCREALRLRLSEDLSNPDIAKRMNITTRTVETYMFRAFNHIRVLYKQYASET